MKNFKNKSTTDEIRSRFDNSVERFSNIDTGQSATIDAPLVMELITKAAIHVTPNIKNVLDIGCGAGNNSIKLTEYAGSFNCDLLDLSLGMLEKAKQRLSDVNTGSIRIFQKDFREADLKEGHYDVILAAAVLHHLRDDADWEKAFQKIYDLTAPGGSIWITDLVFHEHEQVQSLMMDRYQNYLEEAGGKEYSKAVFECIAIEDSPRPVTYQLELLKKAGFECIDILHKNSCYAAFGAVKK